MNQYKVLLPVVLALGMAWIVIMTESAGAQAYRYAKVQPYEAPDGKWHLFLPSWANREAEEQRYEGEGVLVWQAENLPSIEIETAGSPGKGTGAAKGEKAGGLEKLRADQDAIIKGKLTVTLADGTKAYEGAIEEMKGRGNTTWTLDKKPFQFKLSDKADLLGMGAAKTWILLANGFDETGIRNTIALTLAEKAGLMYTPEVQPVDLYCDGEYQGCYLLSEKVQVKKNRVDIGDGFLVEREMQDRWEIAVYLEGKQGFQTERGEYYLIDYPENPTEKQKEEIRQLMQEAETAAFAADGKNPATGKAWSEYLDKDSFVRKYLLEEVTKNYDGGVTSAFYYVPEGEEKLYAGPAWDYDLIFGNALLDEINSDPQGVTELSDHLFGPDLYSALMEQEEFRQAVFACFEEVYLPLLEQLQETGIDALAAQNAASMKMDHLRWQEMENRFQYYDSYEDNIRYLKYFVEKRTEFLKEVWMDGKIYRTVTLQVQGHDWRKFYVRDGGLLGDLPKPYGSGQAFVGWYRADGKRYDPYRPIFQDMVFEAAFALPTTGDSSVE